jgi:hypothetical protein
VSKRKEEAGYKKKRRERSPRRQPTSAITEAHLFLFFIYRCSPPTQIPLHVLRLAVRQSIRAPAGRCPAMGRLPCTSPSYKIPLLLSSKPSLSSTFFLPAPPLSFVLHLRPLAPRATTIVVDHVRLRRPQQSPSVPDHHTDTQGCACASASLPPPRRSLAPTAAPPACKPAPCAARVGMACSSTSSATAAPYGASSGAVPYVLVSDRVSRCQDLHHRPQLVPGVLSLVLAACLRHRLKFVTVVFLRVAQVRGVAFLHLNLDAGCVSMFTTSTSAILWFVASSSNLPAPVCFPSQAEA